MNEVAARIDAGVYLRQASAMAELSGRLVPSFLLPFERCLCTLDVMDMSMGMRSTDGARVAGLSSDVGDEGMGSNLACHSAGK